MSNISDVPNGNRRIFRHLPLSYFKTKHVAIPKAYCMLVIGMLATLMKNSNCYWNCVFCACEASFPDTTSPNISHAVLREATCVRYGGHWFCRYDARGDCLYCWGSGWLGRFVTVSRQFAINMSACFCMSYVTSESAILVFHNECPAAEAEVSRAPRAKAGASRAPQAGLLICVLLLSRYFVPVNSFWSGIALQTLNNWYHKLAGLSFSGGWKGRVGQGSHTVRQSTQGQEHA